MVKHTNMQRAYTFQIMQKMGFGQWLLEETEYQEWNTMFSKAKETMGPQREELLEGASEMIENDLILLGAVAVEDKLQKGVSFSFTNACVCVCMPVCLRKMYLTESVRSCMIQWVTF